ncbi:helix-turn-helix transcriptional regulator [Endozoicomonas arenosclerae]|uniref:helix-turn-helix transcriptional regulator n=1 Tax=Endozoicomonas arenosclerae TaxID=1633495 RepID=UPI000785FB04|nr:AlpA family phage regulatory protein [Endozoicomonas arenosclerae]
MTAQAQTYLTRQQVLTRYGIGNTTLYRWMNDDTVSFPKSVQMGPRCVRWELSTLEAWEEQRKSEAA